MNETTLKALFNQCDVAWTALTMLHCFDAYPKHFRTDPEIIHTVSEEADAILAYVIDNWDSLAVKAIEWCEANDVE